MLKHFPRSRGSTLSNIYPITMEKWCSSWRTYSPGTRERNTSSNTLTRVCASSTDRRLMASTSPRSDNRSAIKEMRSLVVRGRSIKRFHTGTPLRMRNLSGRHTHGSTLETHKLHESRRARGRRWTSRSQHRCVSPHSLSVNTGSIGRGGRSSLTIAKIAARCDLSLNGMAPVKTLIQNFSSPNLSPNRSSAANLDSDHRKRENIRLLAVSPPAAQDLRCDPSCAVPVFVRSTPDRI